MKLRYLVLFFLLMAAPPCFSQLLNFQNFGLEEGLPATGAFDFAMGKDGLLWIATDGGGIANYDGHLFRHYDHRSGLSASTIRAILCDDDGDIWAASSQEGLFRYSGTWQSFRSVNDFHFGDIRAMCMASEGRIFVGTATGVAEVRGDSAYLPAWNRSLPHLDIRALTFSQDTLWVGTDHGLAFVTNDGKASTFAGSHRLPSQRIVSLTASSKGGVWVGTSGGLVHVCGEACESIGHSDDFPSKRIRSVCEDVDGTLWIGTYNGVVRLRQNGEKYEQEVYTIVNGLPDNRIRSIYRDPSGSIWFATYLGGISQLTHTHFEHYTVDPMQKFSFSSVMQSDNGCLYAGLFENGIAKICDGRVEILHNGQYSVRSISPPFKGSHWVVHNEGISLIQNDEVRNWNMPDTLANSLFYDCRIFNDRLYVSYHNMILSRSANTKVNEGFKVVAAFETPDVIQRFVMLRDSVIWAITDNQVGYWRSNWEESTFIPVEATQLKGAVFTDIAMDSFRQVWVTSINKGLFRISKGRVSWLHEDNGLFSNRLHQLVFDKDENLWVGGLNGLGEIILTAGNELVESVRHYTFKDGLRHMHTNLRAGYKDSTHTLWFGTLNGLTTFRGDRAQRIADPPVIVIRGIDLFFDDQTHWEAFSDSIHPRTRLPINLSVPHNQNHLTFHFLGTNLANPSAVRYQYRLEGLDDWSPITSRTSVTFTSLPPGRYNFQVMSRNHLGQWNEEPASFSFEVRAPFYLAWWFILSVVLVVILTVASIVRWRVRSLKAEQMRLEREVALRTAQLQEEVKKSDELLLNILPADAARELREKGYADARQYRNVSVMFTDFKGFTQLAEKLSSSELVATLDECFRAFDEIVGRYGLEKIKTIGDAYMCAAGLRDHDDNHAVSAVNVALEMLEFMQEFNSRRQREGKPPWHLRAGIHSGPVVAGIVGKKKFAYDIWGDTVNLAARIEGASVEGKINVSAITRELIKNTFSTEYRGEIEVKNKGAVAMYFVNGKKGNQVGSFSNAD